MIIVTGPNCKNCVTLKNMLNKLEVMYSESDIKDVPKNIISSVPNTLPLAFIGTNLIFPGCPGSISSLKKKLKEFNIKYKGG